MALDPDAATVLEMVCLAGRPPCEKVGAAQALDRAAAALAEVWRRDQPAR